MNISKVNFICLGVLLAALPALGQNLITNIMSPIVSYQYPDDYTSEVLTNGGAQSPFVSYQYLEDYGASALTNGGILSPFVSYQYYEWPGDGILNLQSSPTVSYFWQIGVVSAPAYLHGWVTDAKGAVLSGATVSANVLLTPSAQAITDGSGYYQMPSLGAGVYDLWAVKAGYQTSIRAFTLGTSTADQDFQLQPMPVPPATLQVNRSPTVPYTVGDLMGSQLLIYDGTSFVPVTTNNWPSTNLMTIVMTHGWIPLYPNGTSMFTPYGAASWPSDFAAKMQLQGINPTLANIVAWDWHQAAMTYFPIYGTAADQTTEQGIGLGEALQYYLGASYTQPLHFLGHSLGTLVNASAIDYIHGDNAGDLATTKWANNLIQVTLFDQAQIAEFNPLMFTGVDPAAIGAVVANFQPALPVRFTWADNYGSEFGGYDLSGAVNVELQKGLLIAIGGYEFLPNIIADAHSYAIDWYGESILTPTDPKNPLGFQRSFEYAPSSFPPTIQPPSAYHQSPLDNDELALVPFPLVEQPFGVTGDSVVQTTIDTAQYLGNVEFNAAVSLANAEIGLFNYVWNAAAQGKQAIVNNFNSANSLGVSLTTGPYNAIQHLNNGLVRPMGGPVPAGSGGSTSNTPAMVWLPIQFPANAVAMTFDLSLSGDPANDALVCGVGTNTLFSISAKYIPTNQFSASRLIDVSALAGTTNELFFGFLGGTSTNATLQIQNIQFYSLQQPQLNIVPLNGGAVLAWPTTAAGYVIESTPSLTAPVWETATNVPTISGGSYILTNYWSDQTRFFRLRQN